MNDILNKIKIELIFDEIISNIVSNYIWTKKTFKKINKEVIFRISINLTDFTRLHEYFLKNWTINYKFHLGKILIIKINYIIFKNFREYRDEYNFKFHVLRCEIIK